jgi:hypothetical protein
MAVAHPVFLSHAARRIRDIEEDPERRGKNLLTSFKLAPTRLADENDSPLLVAGAILMKKTIAYATPMEKKRSEVTAQVFDRTLRQLHPAENM